MSESGKIEPYVKPRITSDARRHGVLTPIICDVSRFELKMEHIVGEKLKDAINEDLSEKVGKR